ncbi:hypothetical protein B0T22DRAFT_374635 [Podospora appendiculata]|uniref:NADH-ubiquinone oxidoreductase 21.3 kDa subunit n=1 Tax=Podospora appendiculata TaxID=314037 RepID=A0AAE0XBK6_9PEZI|nr:hypothetical protein B0T22DRAFT_374635 [Podospora appendiculata]
MAPKGDDQYHAQDAIGAGVHGALVGGGAGLFLAALQNSMQRTHVGAWGVFTRGGGAVATFSAMTGIYEFSRIAAANLREKEDHYNHAIGGFLAGAVLGLRTGRMPPILGYGAFTAVAVTAFEYAGGSLAGWKKDPEEDEYERKERLRMNRRRPVEETLAEVGEGRSIRPPGYEERRRLRLKEKYGVDINTVSADPNA